MRKNFQKGFSLIEAVIYIALLGLIMGSTMVVSYQLVGSSQGLNDKNTAGEEGNFVLRKINWALSGTSAPSAFGGYSSRVSIQRNDGNQIDFCLDGGKIKMREGGGASPCSAWVPITTDNVVVSTLQFRYIPSSGGVPAGIEASTTINDMQFYIKKYVRN